MTPKFRKIAVFVGAAALAGGAGIGVAARGDADSAGATPGMTRPAQGGPGATQDGPGAQPLSALAEALGVSETRLRAALEKLRPSGAPGSTPGGPPDSSDMAEALASELGLSADKVRSALEAVGPGGGGPGGAPPAGGAAPGGAAPDGADPGGAAPGGAAPDSSSSGSLS